MAYEATLTILTRMFQEYNTNLPSFSNKNLDEVLQEIQPFSEEFREFCNLLSEKSDNFMMLVQFCFEDFAAFLQMCHAVQSGDHDLRTNSIVQMIPGFFSMDSIHYKRWAILDISIRTSLFPQDLLKFFQETGCWRTNICQRKGAFVPCDQFHETKCNLDMKSNLNRNRMSEEIFTNIGLWLPKRAKFVKEFKEFVFKYKQWNTRNDPERKSGKPEMLRYEEKLKKCIEFLEENTNLTVENLHDSSFKQTLHSLGGGDTLTGKGATSRLLSSRTLGNYEFQKFVQERIISGAKNIGDHIPKMNIEIFPFLDVKRKKAQNPKAKKEKLELKLTSQILRILPHRPIFQSNEIGKYQLSEYTALTSDTINAGPNIRTNKSGAFSDFILKVSPDSVSTIPPTLARENSVVILEGENIIAAGPGQGSKKTLIEHIDAVFKHRVLPFFSISHHVFFMFDDEVGKELKMTDKSRYNNSHEKLSVTSNMIIDDWNTIFKNKENKLKFKILMLQRIENELRHFLDPDNVLYLNGPRNINMGQVTCVTRLSGPDVVPGYTLQLGESDVKIFQLIEKCHYEMKRTEFLIYSLDTDIKFLSIYYSALWFNKLRMIVKSGKNMVPSFFNPLKVCQYMRDSYPQPVLESAEGLLKAYILMGCDSNPGFVNVSHASGLWSFDERGQNGDALTSNMDLLSLILDVYEKRNPGLKRMFPDSRMVTLSERATQLREIIKAFHGAECLTVPLDSVLKLHVMRTEYLFLVMTEPGYINVFPPEEAGWNKISNDGKTRFEVKIQDSDDPLYRVPKNIIKGCSCRGVCTNRCSCKKDKDRLNCCTVITCKSCQCNTQQLIQEPGSEVEDCEVSSDSDNFDDPVTSADSDIEVSSDSETSFSSIDDMVQNDDFDFVSEGEL